MEKKLVAVYGGSFNPPTMSHFEIMRMVIEEVKVGDQNFDEVWMVPCGDRIDKKVSTSGLQRLEMCQIGVRALFGDDRRYKVDSTEIDNGKSIPTYYLIKKFKELHPEYEFYFIIGTDLLLFMNKWESGQEMLNEYKFVVIQRCGYEDIDESLYPFHYVSPDRKEHKYATSSTEIREILKYKDETDREHGLKDKLNGDVYSYIIDNALFL
mmetsp:Transcript_35411/g.40941  ORF Transcript_35411/g.40941 Transcript_35411/m.40941 type:complete len:210 (-) Transcript_35411:26-655(-)